LSVFTNDFSLYSKESKSVTVHAREKKYSLRILVRLVTKQREPIFHFGLHFFQFAILYQRVKKLKKKNNFFMFEAK